GIAATRARLRRERLAERSIGFVPTMGALHEGHLSLMRRAREECRFVAASIFVNPTQFGPSEDYTRYPRDLERDSALAESAGVDLLFSPEAGEIYPEGFQTAVEVQSLSATLEGAYRPGHFRGVATVVAKLFAILQPTRAYFGEKDYQQLLVVRRMARDLNFELEVIGCPIVREADGLALSSRNVYLSPEARRQATCLCRALREVQARVSAGSNDGALLTRQTRELIAASPLAQPDYVAICDPDNLAPLTLLDRPARMLVAAKVDGVRLIDNALLLPAARQTA
ncbi:MAG TPA: pantoate--beta-alanine ligase, partial [Chthonomonadales bacterium]|nr:pantoate--beta-alanine ligase [Chthonomonadales bacterium]